VVAVYQGWWAGKRKRVTWGKMRALALTGWGGMKNELLPVGGAERNTRGKKIL